MKTNQKNYSDIFRKDFKGYMEPILLTGLEHEGDKLGITRSKTIRYACIEFLIKRGFPLNVISNKFNAFYRGISHNM